MTTRSEYITTGRIPDIPVTRAWTVRYTDGRVITEGDLDPRTKKPIMWPDIAKDNIEVMVVMGLVMPAGGTYDFYRVATASQGNQPVPVEVGLVCRYENDVRLRYSFITAGQ